MKLKWISMFLLVTLLAGSTYIPVKGVGVLEDLGSITDESLYIDENSTVDENAKKKGYTLSISGKVECIHTKTDVCGTVKCMPAKVPLNPSRKELQNNIVLTGKFAGKDYTYQVKEYDAGGIDNTVSHLQLLVKVDAPGVLEKVLAEPYVCPDGNAAYSYFAMHYAYCSNTKRFYSMGSSHTWLGCTRGDRGNDEYRFQKYAHDVIIYRFVPNTYKVSYNANGGSGSMGKQSAVYDTAFNLNANKFTRTGYTFAGWNTKADGSGTAYTAAQKVKNLTDTNGGTVTLYAQWTPNTYTVTLNHQLESPKDAGTETI